MYDALELIRLGISHTETADKTFYRETPTGIAADVIGAGRVAAIQVAYDETVGPMEDLLRHRMRPLSHQYEAWHREATVQEQALLNALTPTQRDVVSSMPSTRTKGKEVSLTEAAIYLHEDTGLTRLGVLELMSRLTKEDHIETLLDVTDHRLMTPKQLAELV